MFKLIKSIFRGNRSETEQSTNSVLCSVNIELNYNQEISIKYFWPEFNKNNDSHLTDVAHSFGSLLYLVNHGHLKIDMIETLSHTVNPNNNYDIQFSEEVFKRWLDMISADKGNPMVSPSTVFKQYKV